MRGKLRTLYQKASYITVSFVLAVSTMAAAVPFLLTQEASALPVVSHVDVSATDWTKDRTLPSGGFGPAVFAGRDALRLGVDAPTNASTSFYQYEGVKKDVPAGTTDIQADLYIDSSWPSNVRAGFWTVGYDGGAVSAYPIIEYNTASSTNWRIWDSAGAGGWAEVTVPFNTDAWNTIQFEINPYNTAQTFIYVNGTQVGSSTGNSSEELGTIIFNNYNQGTDDYDVYWSAVQAGVSLPGTPEGLEFYNASGVIADGSYVDTTDVMLRWNTLENIERYQVRVTDPSGASQSNRYTGWYTFDLDDSSRFGFFGTQQGEWTYEVRAKSATTGLWSTWSAPATLNFDDSLPTITVKSSSVGSTTDHVYSNVSFKLYDRNAVDKYVINGVEVQVTNNKYSDANFQNIKNKLIQGATNTIVVYDVAGKTAQYSFVYDTTAPTITVKSDFVGDETADLYSAVSFKLYDAFKVAKYEINGVERTVTPNKYSDANFQNIKSKLIDGAVNTIRLYDVAGNWSEYSFTYDATAPTVEFVNFESEDNFFVPVMIGDQEGESYQWVLESGSETGIAVSDDTELMPIFVVLEDGTYTLSLIVTDAAGNEQTVGPIELVYNTPVVEAPVTPIVPQTAGGQSAQQTPTPTPVAFTPAPQADDTAVLGETDEADKADVKGTSTEQTAQAVDGDNDEQVGLWGLAWYWWVLIVAAAATLLWWILAALRRRNSEE